MCRVEVGWVVGVERSAVWCVGAGRRHSAERTRCRVCIRTIVSQLVSVVCCCSGSRCVGLGAFWRLLLWQRAWHQAALAPCSCDSLQGIHVWVFGGLLHRQCVLTSCPRRGDGWSCGDVSATFNYRIRLRLLLAVVASLSKLACPGLSRATASQQQTLSRDCMRSHRFDFWVWHRLQDCSCGIVWCGVLTGMLQAQRRSTQHGLVLQPMGPLSACTDSRRGTCCGGGSRILSSAPVRAALQALAALLPELADLIGDALLSRTTYLYCYL